MPTGRWSIPSNGYPTTMPWCASMCAAPAIRRAMSIPGRRARLGTFMNASNGRRRSRGATAKSGFAMDAWQVASLQPPHLAAICAWEGGADFYRDVTHHGGIFCEFLTNWYPRAVIAVQYGIGERGARSRVTGDLVAGPPTLPEETLAKNRCDLVGDAFAHPLADAYHAERSPV